MLMDRVFRAIHRIDRVWGAGISAKVIWTVVRNAPKRELKLRMT